MPSNAELQKTIDRLRAELATLQEERGPDEEYSGEIKDLRDQLGEESQAGDCIGFLPPVAMFVALGALFRLTWVGCPPDVTLTLGDSCNLHGVSGASWIGTPNFGTKQVILTKRYQDLDGKTRAEEHRLGIEYFRSLAMRMPPEIAAYFQDLFEDPLPDETDRRDAETTLACP